jgi:hypothetical protein
MKLIVFLLITLAVFSEEDHREQGIIEKSYFHDLTSDFDQNPYDLIRDFQLHCESSEGSLITINEGECLEILNDGKPKGFSDSESQCVFTYKIDPDCMDGYLDRSNAKDDVCTAVVKGRFKTSSGASILQITIGWNNIKKFVEDPLDGTLP